MYNALESVLRSGRELISEEVFYGFFLASLHKEIVYRDTVKSQIIRTAAVSRQGFDYMLYVNEEFWEDLSPTERIAILKHELNHITRFHPTLAMSYTNKELFNIAADIEINQYISGLPGSQMSLQEYQDYVTENTDAINEGTLRTPFRAMYMEDFGFLSSERGKGTRYYYDRLVQLSEGKGGGRLQSLVNTAQQIERDGTGGTGHTEWNSITKDLSSTAKELLEENTKSTLKHIYENSSMDRGTIPAELKELIEELIKKKPPVLNWKAAMRKFFSYSTEYYTTTSRRKLNKRIPEFAAVKIREKKKVLCALDTSGSMSQNDIREAFSEIHNAWKAGLAVDVAECDARLNEEEDVYAYKGEYPKKRKGLSGRGGTAFDDPIDYFNRHKKEYCALIYLTDGYAPCPKVKPVRPMMWILSTNGKTASSAQSEGFPGRIIKMNNVD